MTASLIGEDPPATSTPGTSTPSQVQSEDASSHDPSSADTQSVQDGDEGIVPPITPKEPVVDRTELLRSKPGVVGRFLHLMVPILVDVYAASVMTPVRIKTLTGLLKAVSFLDADELIRVFKVRLYHHHSRPRRLTFVSTVRSHRDFRLVDSFLQGPSKSRHRRAANSRVVTEQGTFRV